MKQNPRALKDICVITTKIFDQFIPQNIELYSKIRAYDTYRAMKNMIENIDLVANHYLVLTFDEEYLQNSSLGEAKEKWRYFFNKDLETLNSSITSYLHTLAYLSVEDECGMAKSFTSELYNSKVSYGFVRDSYSVGYVEPSSLVMISTVLSTKFQDENIFSIAKHKKISLATHEERVQFQAALKEANDSLKLQKEKLKHYMLLNYTFEDLL